MTSQLSRCPRSVPDPTVRRVIALFRARSFLFFLVLTVGQTMGTVCAQAATPAELQNSLNAESGIIRIGDRAIDLPPLKEFYRQRGYKLAWSGVSGENQASHALADAQTIAFSEGLSPDVYVAPRASSDIERDLLVSDALLRLGRDLASGRVVPTRAVGGMGPETRPSFDGTRFLNDLAKGKSLAAQIRPLLPAYAGYVRLRNAQEKYRRFVQQGGWPTIPDGPSIKPDQEDDRVPALRKRLIASGDLASELSQGTVLDAPLQEALKKFQAIHGLDPDGSVGKRTLAALNVSAQERLNQIAMNLERWRWMPRRLAAEHIAVNLPAAQLELVENGLIVLTMRAIVGDVNHPTPTMLTSMPSLVLNPTWTVPPSIASHEILPKLRKDPNYLAINNLRILDVPEDSPQVQGQGINWAQMGDTMPYRLRQSAGPDNALGQIKFNLSNRDDIYLHDTPKRGYFGRHYRALSHGCVRVERPVDLAEAVLGNAWRGKVPDQLAENNTKTLRLERTLTVYLLYMTSWADDEGVIHFTEDMYDNDARLKAALKRYGGNAAPAQVAQDGGVGSL